MELRAVCLCVAITEWLAFEDEHSTKKSRTVTQQLHNGSHLKTGSPLCNHELFIFLQQLHNDWQLKTDPPLRNHEVFRSSYTMAGI